MSQRGNLAAANESRTATVRSKRALAPARGSRANSPALPNKRRRRNPQGEQDIRDFVPSGSSFTVLSSLDNVDDHGASNDISYHERLESKANMAESGLGRNRLKSGFIQQQPPAPQSSANDVSAEPGSRAGSEVAANKDEHSITISDGDSDEEMEDSESEGGMTLNVQRNSPAPIIISDDEESGEILESTSSKQGPTTHDGAGHSPQHDDSPTFVIDPLPTKTQIQMRLADLDPANLEKQLRYAYWSLPRDQIDLNRPVVCLYCHVEGHLELICPGRTCTHCGSYDQHESRFCPVNKRCDRCREHNHEGESCMKNTTIPCDLCGLHGHVENECATRYHTSVKFPTGQIKLWISCARCASKTHLVGDCPKVNTAQASRWSLKSLDPNQIVNLSIQTGTRKLEQEAENRGVRPPGLQIKGRAAQRQAQAAEAERQRRDFDSDNSEDDFWGRPPPYRSDQYRPRAGGTGGRYDRFNAPSNDRSYRPPRNSFYATDSFGRPRSHSPRGHPDDYFDERRRRRTPPGNDSWRPREPPRRGPPSPPPRGKPSSNPGQAPTRPKPNIQIQLPRRPSTGPNSNNLPAQAAIKARDSAPSSNTETSSTAGSKKKRRKRQNKEIRGAQSS